MAVGQQLVPLDRPTIKGAVLVNFDDGILPDGEADIFSVIVFEPGMDGDVIFGNYIEADGDLESVEAPCGYPELLLELDRCVVTRVILAAAPLLVVFQGPFEQHPILTGLRIHGIEAAHRPEIFFLRPRVQVQPRVVGIGVYQAVGFDSAHSGGAVDVALVAFAPHLHGLALALGVAIAAVPPVVPRAPRRPVGRGVVVEEAAGEAGHYQHRNQCQRACHEFHGNRTASPLTGNKDWVSYRSHP